MRKILGLFLGSVLLIYLGYVAFVYYVPYSEGTRAGELIKFSYRGVVVKTWEGELSQGISGAQIFSFSVLDQEKEVIKKLKEFQGGYVKLHYVERYATLAIWGETKYFITEVEKIPSPHFNRN